MKKQTHGFNGPELTDEEQLAAYEALTQEEWEQWSEFQRKNTTLKEVNEARAIRLENWKKQLG